VTLDPAQWSWGKLALAGAAWAAALTILAGWLVARVISHAKETDLSGGDFIVSLPYGTRHLTIYILAVLVPLVLAVARKLAAG
jgi:hypothetical protein